MRWQKLRALALIQLYGQVGLLAFQFLAVPSFLSTWGSALYGEWLVIMAIPLLFAQLNVGFGSAAAPIMAKALHEGKSGLASAALLAALFATTVVVLLVIGIAALVFWLAPPGFGREWSMPLSDLYTVIGCGIVIACASLYKDDIYCTFYASDRQPLGDFLANTLFFTEGLATIGMLVLFHVSPATLAIVLAGLRVVLIGASGVISIVKCRPAWRLRGVSRDTFRAAFAEQSTPAIGYFLDPISNIIQNTGLVFVAGTLLGPVAAATMHSHRLLGRISWQATAALRSMTTREVLRFYALGDMKQIRHSTKLAFSAFFWISAVCVVGLLVVGPTFVRFWLGGKLALDMPLFAALVLAGFCGSVLMGLRSMLQVDNRHAKLAWIEFRLTMIAIGVVAVMFWFGLPLYVSGLVLIVLYLLCLSVALQHTYAEVGIPPIEMLVDGVTMMPTWIIHRLRRRRGAVANSHDNV